MEKLVLTFKLLQDVLNYENMKFRVGSINCFVRFKKIAWCKRTVFIWHQTEDIDLITAEFILKLLTNHDKNTCGIVFFDYNIKKCGDFLCFNALISNYFIVVPLNKKVPILLSFPSHWNKYQNNTIKYSMYFIAAVSLLFSTVNQGDFIRVHTLFE